MRDPIYYRKGFSTDDDDMHRKAGFDWPNGADKSVRYMQALLRLINRPEYIEGLVRQHADDKSVAIHFETRIDHFREYFSDETPYDVSTVLAKYPALSYIGVRFISDRPYVSFDFVI